MKSKPTVLFVSNNGPGRSLMAATLLEQAAGDIVDICYYADPTDDTNDEAASAVSELESSGGANFARTTLKGESIDLVIVLDRLQCGGVSVDVESASLPRALDSLAERNGSGRRPPRLGWPVEDPTLVSDPAARKIAYRRARFTLSDHIEVMVGQGYLNLL